MTAHQHFMKAKDVCPCEDPGCTAYGLPRGRRGHVKDCTCTVCARASQSTRAAKAHQRVGRRFAGSSSAAEESWRGPERLEVKTDKRIAGGIVARWRECRDQAPRAYGDTRGFVLVVEHDGQRLVVMDERQYLRSNPR